MYFKSSIKLCSCLIAPWIQAHWEEISQDIYIMNIHPVNPIPTKGGGGGGQFDPPPPLHEFCDCLVTATDRDTPFHEFFLSSLTHLLIPSMRKSDHQSQGHVMFCTRISAQNLPKIRILHMYVTVQNTLGNYWFSYKVLGHSVGLCKTTKRKGKLFIILLVDVWRIICENFNPIRLILAEIWMKI